MTRHDEAAGELRSLQLQPELRKALEAILLVVDEPVDAVTLAQVLEAPTEEVTEALEALRDDYATADRGFILRDVGGGWRLYTEPSVHEYVERFVQHGRSGKLSQAALETLAIVAYKQPVTRGQVSEIRGVDADGALRSLLQRDLVEEVGREPSPGQPMLYGTTPTFLEQLGLRSLDELPPLPELDPGGTPPPEPQPGGYKAARRELDALDRDEREPSRDADPELPGEHRIDDPPEDERPPPP